MLQALLDGGAAVDAKTIEGDTGKLRHSPQIAARLRASVPSAALHHAASSGQERVVRLLLSGGADPNAKDNDGCTALFTAIAYRTALFTAAPSSPRSSLEVILALLEGGAAVNAINNEGRTGEL